MPVVGSTITTDLHVTEDADLDSLHAVVRQNERVHPSFAQAVRQAVETNARSSLEAEEVEGYALDVTVELVTGRVPGAPRERVTTELNVEGDDAVVAAVDSAISAPQRADIADAVEAGVLAHLGESGLAAGVEVIVSVTPIEFR